MYLTRMELNETKRKTIMALSSPAIFHGAIEGAFEEKGGKLWRVDSLSGKLYLLLVSKDMPNFEAARTQFGMEKGWETVEYDTFLNAIQVGERRRFRLKANPVISRKVENGRGTIYSHCTTVQQEKWLMDRADKYGFHLEESEFSAVVSAWESFKKGDLQRHNVRFHTVVFEGTLTVTDPELLRHTLCNGIGREKAYGCGLMTVTRSLK